MSEAKTLELNALTVHYSGAASPALKSCSLTVHSGDCLAVVGRSGAGKTTLLNALTGLISPESLKSGQYKVAGQTIFDANSASGLTGVQRNFRNLAGRLVFTIFQEPRATLDPDWTIEAQLREVAELKAPNPSRADLIQFLAMVELQAEVLDLYPANLSVGMCQRVQIAMAFASGASFILADEPIARIDPGQRSGVIAGLKKLLDSNNQTQAGLIVITHNPNLVDALADQVLVLKAGETEGQGATSEVFTRDSQCGYIRHYLETFQQLRESGIATITAADQTPQPISRTRSQSSATPPLLKGVNLGYSYVSASRSFWARPTKKPVFDSIDIEIQPREIVALVGESGGGKTTLARLCGGITSPDSGQIQFGGAELETIYSQNRRKLSWRMQFVFQEADQSMDPLWTVGESLKEAYFVNYRQLRLPTAEALSQQLVAALGLELDHLAATPAHLSGGQKKRAALARCLAALGWGLENPPEIPGLLILDEPLSGLDPILQSQVMGVLYQAQTQLNLSYLWISHDLPLMRQIADRVAVIYRGRVIELSENNSDFLHPYSQRLESPLATATQSETQSAPTLANPCIYLRSCPLHTDQNCIEQGSVGVTTKKAVACQIMNKQSV